MEYHHCLLMVTIAASFISDVLAENNRECSLGLRTPGITVPRGDIVVEHGNSLEIFCTLNDDYIQKHGPKSSESLRFFRQNEKLPIEMVDVINSSTVRLYVAQPPPSSSLYYCYLGEEATNSTMVCLNNVAIGTKPQNVTDFKCIGSNHDNLTCSWTAPKNYVKTTYHLSYHFRGRSNRGNQYVCPNSSTLFGEGPMKCFWDIRTAPQYRQAQPIYYFTLTMDNVFGKNVLNKTFNHFQHVIPGPPENLTVVNTTYNSITIVWSISPSMMIFPPGLIHRILFQSQYEKKDRWQSSENQTLKSDPKRNRFECTLHNLKYAHALYDIRISSRSKEAKVDDESVWSKNASLVVTTASTVPGAPPNVNIGSFEVIRNSGTNREVYIYWQQVPSYMENGENFSYRICTQEYPLKRNCTVHPAEVTSAYAKFKDLNTTLDYTFTIESKNEVGSSNDKSYVHVPSEVNHVPEPSSFTKIAFANGVYELSWDPPPKNVQVKSYTIFWCSNERDRPYQCKGYLKWIEVPSHEHLKNISLPEQTIFQFAISANTELASSGMVWASCTVIHDKSFGKMKSVWINNIGSTFIEISWNLDCSDRIGSVEGFIIYYCPIVSPKESNCKGPQQNHTLLGDKNLMRANITDLNPYTTYMLLVSVINKHSTQSQPSDPRFNTTLEAAPAPYPINLTVSAVTNTSITVSWLPPTAMNGVLRFYKLKYNNNEPLTINSHTGTKYTLTGLESFKEYNITVQACTVACSSPAPLKSVTTKIGVPGVVKKPYVSTKNESYVKVEWTAPAKTGGMIDMYQLRVRVLNENKTIYKNFTNETSYKFYDCTKENGRKTYYFAVRAVNVGEKELFEGPWSEENENFCRQPTDVYVYVGLAFCGVLFVCGIYFITKRVYTYFKNMQNVVAKLPPGLAPIENFDMTQWPEHAGPDDSHIQHTPTDSDLDEELLPKRLSKNELMGSRDSSGCSSGHASVTSSLESGTHISNVSDSGTEQTRVPSLDEPTMNSLRRRPTSTSGCLQMPMDGTTKLWCNNKGNATSSYSVLGVNPATPIENSPVYSVERIVKPAAICGQPIKTADGYIPLNSAHVNSSNEQHSPHNITVEWNDECLGLTTSKLMQPVCDLMNLELCHQPKLGDELSSRCDEMNPPYVQVANLADVAHNYVETGEMLDLKTDQTGCNDHLMSWPSGGVAKGYVTLGEVPTKPQVANATNKGYVPHRQFDAKALKED